MITIKCILYDTKHILQDNYHAVFSNKDNSDSDKNAKLRTSKLQFTMHPLTKDKHAHRELSSAYIHARTTFSLTYKKTWCYILEPRGHCARPLHKTVVHELRA